MKDKTLKALKMLIEIVDHNLDPTSRPDYSNWFDGLDDDEAFEKLSEARELIKKELGI